MLADPGSMDQLQERGDHVHEHDRAVSPTVEDEDRDAIMPLAEPRPGMLVLTQKSIEQVQAGPPRYPDSDEALRSREDQGCVPLLIETGDPAE